MSEPILNLGNEGPVAFEKATDPAISNVATPGDFAAQYPQPLDPREIIAMCEEVSTLSALPEIRTGLKAEYWRELNELAFTSGSAYVSFADGACPEEYAHDGDNYTVTLKNIGAKKSLTISDILHSRAVASGYGDGINTLVAPGIATEGMPGGMSQSQMGMQVFVGDLKAKEIELASILVMNGWDNLLVNGSTNTSSLQFDGFANWESAQSVTFHTNATNVSGAFSAADFDRFLSEACVKPQTVFGNPAAIQEMMTAYFEKGFQGSQVVNVSNGNRLTPGYNFASMVNTAVGTLSVVADTNFTKTASYGSYFWSYLYAMRMTHMGVPLVYRTTQIPLGFNDLTPGCTAISFQIWAKTALVIKHACAHNKFRGFFTGRTGITTCPAIG